MRERDAGVPASWSDAIEFEVIRELRSTWGGPVQPLRTRVGGA